MTVSKRSSERRRRADRAGRLAETLCALSLRLRGYRILDRRFRTPVGELDIVARRGRVLVFVEVKARASLALAAESIAARQRLRVVQVCSIIPPMSIRSRRTAKCMRTPRRSIQSCQLKQNAPSILRSRAMMNEPPASQSALIAILNRRPLRIAAWVLVVAVGATGVVGGVHRGLAGQPDWRTFVAESQYAWEHGAIDPTTKMFAYLPAAYFFLWPFTVALPHPIGLIAFVAVNASAAVISIWLVRRYWFGPDAQRGARRFVWPLLLAIAHFQHVLQANQFTLMILALCVGGLALVMQRRDAAGGFLLGIAACLKVTPICFAALFLLRRQWNALAGMVLALVVCNLVPSLLVFGADGAVREHAAWLRRVDAYANRRFIEDPWLRVAKHRANCSLAVVLSRWLRQPPDATTQVVLRGDDVPPGVVAATRAALRPDEHLSLDPMPERDRPWSIERIDLGDRSFAVLHLPGHSPGSIGLWDEANGLLFSGDAVYDGPLLADLPGTDKAAYAATLKRLRDLPVEVVHAGHDPSFGRDRLHAIVREYLDLWEAS